MPKQIAALLRKPDSIITPLEPKVKTNVIYYANDEVVDLDAFEVIYRCPVCWRPLRLHIGLRVVYWQCTRNPKCRATVPDVDGLPRGIKPKIIPLKVLL